MTAPSTPPSPWPPRRCRAGGRSDGRAQGGRRDFDATLGADPEREPTADESPPGRPPLRRHPRGGLLDGGCRSAAPRLAVRARRRRALPRHRLPLLRHDRVTRDIVAEDLPITLVDVLPELTVAEQDAEYGARLYERDPGSLLPDAQGRAARARASAPTRRGSRACGARSRRPAPTPRSSPGTSKNGLVKINPIAAWTFDDVIDYAGEHQVEVNPLLSDGYPSIGCEPCTRRVAPGEDPRAGRWAGFAKTECGLHT